MQLKELITVYSKMGTGIIKKIKEKGIGRCRKVA